MPLRGLTAHGVLWITCHSECLEGHVELTLEQTGDTLTLTTHREGRVLSSAAVDVRTDPPIVVVLRDAMGRGRVTSTELRSLSAETTEALAPVAPLLTA